MAESPDHGRTFSGATRGFCIGHIGPEAALNGPIALLRDGDIVRIDAERGSGRRAFEADSTAAKRVGSAAPVNSGYIWKYAQQVGSARHGATHQGQSPRHLLCGHLSSRGGVLALGADAAHCTGSAYDALRTALRPCVELPPPAASASSRALQRSRRSVPALRRSAQVT